MNERLCCDQIVLFAGKFLFKGKMGGLLEQILDVCGSESGRQFNNLLYIDVAGVILQDNIREL